MNLKEIHPVRAFLAIALVSAAIVGHLGIVVEATTNMESIDVLAGVVVTFYFTSS